MNEFLSPKYQHLENTPNAAEEVAARIAAKEPIWNVARFYGLTQGQLLRWLTTDPDRAVIYANALKACSHNILLEGLEKASQADALVHRGLRIAGTATEDTAGVSRLEIDACMKGAGVKMGIAKFNVDVAGVLNPERYGRNGDAGGAVVGALTAVLREISERRQAERLAAQSAQRVELDVTPALQGDAI